MRRRLRRNGTCWFCRYGKAVDRLVRQRLIGTGIDQPFQHRARLLRIEHSNSQALTKAHKAP